MKIKTTYIVELIDEDENRKADIRFTGTFNKKEITNAFVNLCKQSKPGDTIAYGKQDQKYAYAEMLIVENINGQLNSIVTKGERWWYKVFDLERFAQTASN